MTDWHGRVDLVGPRLLLTALTLNDANAFLAAAGDADAAHAVFQHLSYAAPTTAAEAAAVIEQALADPDRIAYAQRLRSTGELIGTTSFYEINPGVRSIAIGHTWLARPWWRTGVNTESKLIMLRRAFDELSAERVVWHTDIRNLRSQAAIERLGATKEGVLRHHRLRRDGSWRDTVQYSLISQEWPATKARLCNQLPLELSRSTGRSRYEATIGADLVGLIDFSERGATVLINHTGTEPIWRNCGIAAKVTRFALDDVRVRGGRVRPLCSYTRSFIRDHPEFADLVD
jgi:N-acetyltransferase